MLDIFRKPLSMGLYGLFLLIAVGGVLGFGHYEWETPTLITAITIIALAGKMIYESVEDWTKQSREKQEATSREYEGIKQEVATVQQDVTVLKEDVTVLKEDVTVLKEDVTVLKEGQAHILNILGEIVVKLDIPVDVHARPSSSSADTPSE